MLLGPLIWKEVGEVQLPDQEAGGAVVGTAVGAGVEVGSPGAVVVVGGVSVGNGRGVGVGGISVGQGLGLQEAPLQP